MNNKTNKQIIIGAIALVLFLVLSLAIPFPKRAAFWIAFVFGIIAIVTQAYVMKTAFYEGEPVKSKFYGYPIARIGIIYLAVQISVSFVLMAIGFVVKVPAWVALVICVLILGFCAIGFIAADIMRGEVERQDVQLKADVKAMRSLQSKTVDIVGLCSDEETKAALSSLAEKFRYSDPVSGEETVSLETDLAAAVDELQAAVIDDDFSAAKALASKIEAALNERNRICKLNK